MQTLDYEAKRLRPARKSTSGVISMLAASVQIPWAGFVILMALGDRWHIDPMQGGAPQDSPIYLFVALLPAMIGIPLGVYSIRKIGFGKTNLGGTIGVTVFVCYLLWGALASRHP